jgi:uncharacterized protein (TIGR02246 family)
MQKERLHPAVHRLLLGLLFSAVTVGNALSADTAAADEEAIRKNAAAYVEAYNRRDAKAVAGFWSPDAVYIVRTTGEQLVGREAIEREFTAAFKEKDAVKLAASVESVQFISPNVAVERGKATMAGPDKSSEETLYTAVHVKRDGKWLLDRITEEEVPVVLSNYEKLKELEWMIGDWVDDDEEDSVQTTCQWTKNKNFIVRSFTVSVKDRIEMAGMQVIGWDAATKRIRSWVFDSDGGFGEGVWQRKGNRWSIKTTGVLPDGKKSSAVNILTYVDKDRFTWQSVNREVDGEPLSNVDEFAVIRQKKAD